MQKRNPIILIHGLWNSSSIFSFINSKLDDNGIEYFAPTLFHSYGMTSIIDLTKTFNDLIVEKYGLVKQIDVLGFSMGGIIARNWIQKFDGYKRTRRFISIGSPHKGTFASQLVPKYPFRGISEMKLNSAFLRDLSRTDYLLKNIECVSFFTYWDLMVFPGWTAHLNHGEKIALNVFKHRNLVRKKEAIDKIFDYL